MIMKTNRISFQGEYGANSDMACRDVFPNLSPLPCATFEDAFAAVEALHTLYADVGRREARLSWRPKGRA